MKNKINKKEVGERIRFIRLNRGYTIHNFGDLFGASRGNVQAWESGACLPNKRRLQKIAQLGNLTVNELLYGDSEHDIEELEQRLMEIPTEERVELILRVLKETSKSIKEKSSY